MSVLRSEIIYFILVNIPVFGTVTASYKALRQISLALRAQGVRQEGTRPRSCDGLGLSSWMYQQKESSQLVFRELGYLEAY